MAEERLRLRHGGHKKWARDARRFAGHQQDSDVRDAYHEMVREKNALKDRQRRTKQAAEASSESESEEDLKEKVREMAQESGEESSSDGDEVKMAFEEGRKRQKVEEKEKGIMGMKFMKNAEKADAEKTKLAAQMLLEEVEDKPF